MWKILQGCQKSTLLWAMFSKSADRWLLTSQEKDPIAVGLLEILWNFSKQPFLRQLLDGDICTFKCLVFSQDVLFRVDQQLNICNTYLITKMRLHLMTGSRFHSCTCNLKCGSHCQNTPWQMPQFHFVFRIYILYICLHFRTDTQTTQPDLPGVTYDSYQNLCGLASPTRHHHPYLEQGI